MQNDIHVAIIGCGLAGMVFGRILFNNSINISIFDKSRGPGGRLACKRSEFGDIDFGAQYFTCRTSEFQNQVNYWISKDIIKLWNVNPKVINSIGSFEKTKTNINRYIGFPKMTSISRDIESSIKSYIYYNTLITKISKTSNGKWILNDNLNNKEYDYIIINTPPLQALPFLNNYNEFTDICNDIIMNPCWAVSLTFKESLHLPFHCSFVNCSNISWISNNSSKDGRIKEPETWIIHANINWTKEHLEETQDNIIKQLSNDFFTIINCEKKEILHSIAHRWRYSIASNPLSGKGYLFDNINKIGLCGDWLNKGKVEGAYMSGYNLANEFLIQNTNKTKETINHTF